jgi:drug/metabolite transporter (DMT)-like permease
VPPATTAQGITQQPSAAHGMTAAGAGPRPWVGWAAAIGAVSMWSGWAVATRGTLLAGVGDGAAPLDVWDLVALRFLVASLIALPLLRTHPPRLGRLGTGLPGLARLLVAAGMGGFSFSLCNTGGLAFAPAAHGGAMVAPLGAVTTGLLAAFVLGERLSRARALGLGLIVAGVVLLVFANAVAAPPPTIFLGHAMFVGAAVQWATYTVVIRGARLHPLEALVLACLGSALLYLPAWLLLRGPAALLAAPWQTLVLQGVLHGVVGQTASIALFTFAVTRLGAARAAACGALVPPMVATGAWLFLGETPSMAELPGLAALTFGVWRTTTAPMAPAEPPPARG